MTTKTVKTYIFMYFLKNKYSLNCVILWKLNGTVVISMHHALLQKIKCWGVVDVQCAGHT